IVLCVAAREAVVRREIDWISGALHMEPERVGISHLELAQLSRLSSALHAPHAIAILNLGGETTDLCLAVAGVAEAGRTVSLGVASFPDGADRLVASIRQTLAGFASQTGYTPSRLVLCGEG